MRGDMSITTVENVVVRGDIELEGMITLGAINDLIEYLDNVETRLAAVEGRLTTVEARLNALGL